MPAAAHSPAFRLSILTRNQISSVFLVSGSLSFTYCTIFSHFFIMNCPQMRRVRAVVTANSLDQVQSKQTHHTFRIKPKTAFYYLTS